MRRLLTSGHSPAHNFLAEIN